MFEDSESTISSVEPLIRKCCLATGWIACLLLAGSASAAVKINGAGATFPYPLYSKWFSDYAKANPEVQINYQSIGSGGGIRQLLDETVDFGASDAPMTERQLAKASRPVLHFPTVLGAVVVTYNLPDLKEPLKLDGQTVAGIFMGEIEKWNDPRLAALNPGAKLPSTPILVTHRSDGSGTTAAFSEYLSKVSETWKSKMGSGTSLRWRIGLGGKGNEGVTGLIKQGPGAIGYVEQIYAASNRLPVALIRNAAGKFVKPTNESITAAANEAARNPPADFRMSVTNSKSAEAYPIAAFTYLLVYEEMKSEKGVQLRKFLQWAMSEGQKSAPSLHFAPLPKALLPKVRKQIERIRTQ